MPLLPGRSHNIMYSNPLVTIICLCYNHEKYVQKCIESIINQTYSNIEFIIIDNNSIDNSEKIIEKNRNVCSTRFINYNFIKNRVNLGITKALNNALRISKGEYISYISADDTYVLDKTITQLNAFKKINSKYAVICGDCDFIDTNNNKIFLSDDSQIFYEKQNRHETGTNFILRNQNSVNILSNYGTYQTLLRSNYINAATVLIRKEALEKAGLFDESFFYEDWPLWLQISKNYKFYYISKIVLHYRKHSTTMTDSGNKFKLENTKIILREKKYCLNNNYKAFWLEYYTGRIYSFILDKDYLDFLKFIIRARSFSLLYYIFKKIITNIKTNLANNFAAR